MVSLEKRRSGNEWLSAMLIPSHNVVQADISYKDSGLKVLFTFQVWARFFCRSMYFFVFVFPYLLYECVPCHTYGLLTKCEIMMAGYWPSSFFACLWTETKSRSINSQKKNKANIQPS